MSSGFKAWYRKYYLLVNVPVLLLISELVFAKIDLAHRHPFNSENDLKQALQRYEAAPPANHPSLFLMGNSAMRVGIDQTILERNLDGQGHKLRVYNFGLNSTRVSDQEELLDLLLARNLKPRVVVLGVNTYLVNERIAPDSLYPWVERKAPYLYFHRSRIRKYLKSALSELVRGSRKEEYAQFAEGRMPKERREKLFEAYRDHARPASDYPLLPALSRLLLNLQKQGITTYVVLLPMNKDATSQNPAHRPLMDAIRSQLPPETLDLSDRYPDECFKDIGHLNEIGRAKLTADISAWLATQKDLP